MIPEKEKRGMARVLQDLRRGRNIDLVVVLIAGLTLAIVDFLGITPGAWLPAATIASLAVLAGAMLVNRYQLDDVLKVVAHGSRTTFLAEFPPDLARHFESASTVWLVGLQLSRTVNTHYPALEAMLRRGASVHIVLVDPTGEGNRMAAYRNYRPFEASSHREVIERTLSSLQALKEMTQGDLQIRLLDYPLSLGSIAFEPGAERGALYLEHYSFKMPRDWPKFVLTRLDGAWYDHFTTQIRIWWENATPWPDLNSRRGSGTSRRG